MVFVSPAIILLSRRGLVRRLKFLFRKYSIKRIFVLLFCKFASILFFKNNKQLSYKELRIDEFLYAPMRIRNLKYCSTKAKISGSIQEFGVSGGESIRGLAKYYPNEIIWGFDSFEGLPREWKRTETRVVPEGRFRQERLPVVPKNVKLVKGLFNETIPIWLVKNKENVKFIHIDCDLYDSAITVLELLNERITKGTVIVFDDFYSWNPIWKKYENWEQGEWKALRERHRY